jgi:hypothetical protein
MSDQMGLFAIARQCSLESYEKVKPKINKIQIEVLQGFRAHGPMTALAAERLPEFESYGFSTIRVRISELAKMGLLVEVGKDRSRRSPSTIYALAGQEVTS